MSVHDRVILLVDDSFDDVELTLRALAKNGISNEVIVARDGVAALDHLYSQEVDVLPHLVLLDLKLPKLGGLEVLRRIRADDRTRLVPVVVLTSSTEQQDLAQAYQLGANGYVRKPVDFARFVEVARQLVAYWLLLNEVAPAPGLRRA